MDNSGYPLDFLELGRRRQNQVEMAHRSGDWWVIDEILGHVFEEANWGKPMKIWYHVSFVDYPASANVWIKAKHFNEMEMLADYQLANGIDP